MGSRRFGFIVSQSDLSRVFFEGDCSVEDELQKKEMIRITFHVLHVFSL